MFPEGTQSNGSYLLPFKRGSFQGMKAVIPLVFTYKSYGGFKPQWDVLDFIEHCIFIGYGCNLYKCTVSILPPFLPNEYLLETHRDKTKTGEDWEVFAWAVQ